MSETLLQTSQSPLSHREILHQTALKAPKQSGVYMWRSAGKEIIYVGKAKNLHNRLSSYFSGTKDIKTRLLISNARSIEYITTSNEYEAFLLENNLIKKYTPRYNINLKDGKSYPVLRVTNEKWPKVFKTRAIVQDGSHYFGPFPDAGALDTFIETLYEIYPLRHCKRFKEKTTPCMYYHIGRCLAPCCKKVEQPTYAEFIGEIESLLDGKDEETLQKLNRQMKEAAAAMNFEKAARLRDGIKALSILQNQNIVEGLSGNDRDYISSWREGELISFTVLKIRGGKLLGRDNFPAVSLNEDSEVLPEFMSAYYTEREMLPPEIYLAPQISSIINDNSLNDEIHDESKNIQRYLDETFGKCTRIITVTKDIQHYSMHIAALQMAKQNAHEDIIRRTRDRGDFPAMEELKNILSLPRLPVRIEGFDIAHIGGKFPVASLISFLNGNPDKKNYRYFRLKTTDGLIDDFQSMREAVTRRYSRLANEHKDLPDLLLIDGGIGQVNAVDGVLKSLDIDIPIAGLAKRDEEIWRPHTSKPVCLPKRSDGLRLLQRVRDETHRFATTQNQKLRTKENTVSPFAKIPGVGKQREKLLIKKFMTLKNLALAKESEVAETLNIKSDAASKILLSAKELYQSQAQKIQKQKLSLDLPGTTKEKAARAKALSDLAQKAFSDE